MNRAMRVRALLIIIAVPALLAACGEPLGKKPMIAGCEAAARSIHQDLSDAPIDYRAVVGREALLRFEVAQAAGGDPQAVSVKCKVDTRGRLKRIKIDAVRMSGTPFEAARDAFAGAAGRPGPAAGN